MKCCEIMTPNPVMCVLEDNVSFAINLMWDCDCGCVLVVKDMENKELSGIVTDRDIAMHIAKHAYVHPSQARVADCMSSPVIVCQLEDSVETVIGLMGEHQIRRVPVVDKDGCCAGIISQTDILLHAGDIGNTEVIVAVLQSISTPHDKAQKAAVEPAGVEDDSTVLDNKSNDASKPSDKESGENRKKKAEE